MIYERHWEISGNLDDKEFGLANYPVFQNGICKTKLLFDKVFGLDTINRIDFLVDNATSGSGYTPITTNVLNKVVVIKLGIAANDGEAKVAYQFAHELTHVIFRAIWGINKPHANDEEETICTAAALITLKLLYPESFSIFEANTANHSYIGYRNGVSLAASLSYDLRKIKPLIEQFNYK